jgi:hypothetical protein
VCRDVTVHWFQTVRGGSHAGLVHSVECRECRMTWATEPGEFVSVVDGEVCDVMELMRQTQPLLPLKCAYRVSLDKALIAGDAPPEVRADALREPFTRGASLASRVEGYRIVRAVAAIMALVTGVGAIPVMISWFGTSFFASPDAVSLGWWMLAFFLCSLGTGLWIRRHAARARKESLALVARALRPLRPSQAELSAVFAWLKATTHPARSAFNQGELEGAIRILADRSFSGIDADVILRMAARQAADHRASLAKQSPEQGGDGEWGAGSLPEVA